MKQPGWQHGIAAAALLAWAGDASSQSVDTTMARAVIDQPLAMSVQVRGFDWPASRMTPECLHVEIQQGESGDTITPLRLRTVPSGDDGRVVVQISSPQRVTDTVLIGRLRLLCSADYTREFTVLADPPTSATPANRPPLRPSLAQFTPQRETMRNPDPSSGAPAQRSRNITRSDDDALPTTGRPDHQAFDDAALQRLVAAVLLALPANPVPVAEATPDDPARDPAWQALQEEQRQTRAAMAALLARIEHNEHHGNAWRDVSLVAGGILGVWAGLLLMRLVREGLMPRISTPTQATAASIAHRLRRQRARMNPDEEFLAPRDARDTRRDPTSSTPDPGTVQWMPHIATDQPTADEPSPATRWPDADFGHPSLDTTVASIDLLQELAPSVSESPVGVALVLEQRLQELPGKCPWILLRLLELYRQMAQPWNHERVAAQLEALYNIRIVSMAAESSRDEAGLEDRPDVLDSVLQAWSQEDPAPALARLLLRTTAIPALDKPVFEEILLLHGIVQQRQSPWLAAIDCRADTASAHAQPLSTGSPTGSGRRMELLAA
jgi:hypothetical protein